MHEHWQTSTGLPDEIEMSVETAAFGPDVRYNEGRTTLLTWIGTATIEGQLVEEYQVSFSCGSGWVAADGGSRLVHESGDPRRRVHASSALGILLARVAAMGIPELAAKDPLDASTWVGTRWLLVRETVTYGGEIGSKQRLFPARFLGMATAAAAASGDDPTVAKLREIAAACTDYDTFLKAALPIVGSDPRLLALVASKESGLWAEVKGR